MAQMNTEIPVIRFASHLQLLQDFLRSRAVPFGSANDLRAFAGRLARPDPFYEEMSSILRTVMFREHMGLTRAELLDLLCCAVGGPQYAYAEPPLDLEIGQLLVFVNVVLLSLRKRTVEPNAEMGGEEPAAPAHPDISLHVTERAEAADTGAASLLRVNGPSTLPDYEEEHLELSSDAALQGDHSPRFREPPSAHAAPTRPSAVESLARAEDDAQSPLIPHDGMEAAFYAAAPILSPSEEADLSNEPASNASPADRRWSLSRPATVAAVTVLLLLAAVTFRRPRSSRQVIAPPGTATSASGRTTMSPSQPTPTLRDDLTGAAGSTSAPTSDASPMPGDSSPSAVARIAKPQAGTPAGDSQPVGDIGGTSTGANNGGAGRSLPEAAAPVPPGHTRATRESPEAADLTETAGRRAREEPPRAREVFSVQHSSRKGLFSVSSGVMGANLVSAPPPEYPVLAKLTRVEGQVILQAVISRQGAVVATHVLQGHHLLRSAAEGCVRKWRYRPYLVNGRPTDVETIVFVNFQLHR